MSCWLQMLQSPQQPPPPPYHTATNTDSFLLKQHGTHTQDTYTAPPFAVHSEACQVVKQNPAPVGGTRRLGLQESIQGDGIHKTAGTPATKKLKESDQDDAVVEEAKAIAETSACSYEECDDDC
jgi:hypothetical protein